MKQAEDDLTIDLLEGEPVKITRTSAERAQRMGYQGPKDRHACRDCMWCQTRVHFADTSTQFERHWCHIGEFRVKLGGICAHHQRGKQRPREIVSGGEWS